VRNKKAALERSNGRFFLPPVPPVPPVPPLFISVRNSAPRQVVGREIDRHTVSLQYSDVVLSHFPRNIGEHFVTILKLDPESGVGEHLFHGSHELNGIAGQALMNLSLVRELGMGRLRDVAGNVGGLPSALGAT
jgi:hypothetical protein